MIMVRHRPPRKHQPRAKKTKKILDINAAEPGVSLSEPAAISKPIKGKVWVV